VRGARACAAKAEASGFVFHTIDGERYWDSAPITLHAREIRARHRDPDLELEAMCRELVARRSMTNAFSAPAHPQTILTSLRQAGNVATRTSTAGSICRIAARDPRSCSNTNADTRFELFETAVFQCNGWKMQKRADTTSDADQYNSLHEQLIAGWKEIVQKTLGPTGALHLAGDLGSPEAQARSPIWKTPARQAGLTHDVIAMENIGRTPKGAFVDLSNKEIAL